MAEHSPPRQRKALRLFGFLVSGLAALAPQAAAPQDLPACLYVSSYHRGYHWNDAIEEGLEAELAGRCRLHRFYMDANRNPAPEHAAAKAQEALRTIRDLLPRIVIACDDAASKHLVMPYLKDADLPVVFCGVNWTVEPYGYPYRNTTGMIERAPVQPLLKEAKRIAGGQGRVIFIAADVPTQRIEADHLLEVAQEEGLQLEVELVAAFDQWLEAFRRAQSAADIVVMGNPVGIRGWDAAAALAHVQAHTATLTVSFGVYMRPYSVLSMVNVPREQGEWAGQTAALILAGESPANIPIVANRRWEVYVSPALALRAGVRLPDHLMQKAVRIE